MFVKLRLRERPRLENHPGDLGTCPPGTQDMAEFVDDLHCQPTVSQQANHQYDLGSALH